MKSGSYLNCFFCVVALFFSSCVCSRYYAITGYDYRGITTYEGEWADFRESSLSYSKVCDGIEISRIENASLPLIATIIKISLQNEALKIVATEDSRFREGWVRAESTLHFAKRCDTSVAINANFFTYRASPFDLLYKPLGLFIYKGKTLSVHKKDFASFCFGKNNEACVEPCREGDVYFAVSGFNKVIENGKVILNGRSFKLDSRTLLGIDREAKNLFILCIDGELKKRSRGATLIEAARFFCALGVFEGIELDGGGSSTVVAKIGGRQEQLVPSSKKQLRKVAINLGFVVR